jgi:hypothetical protein
MSEPTPDTTTSQETSAVTPTETATVTTTVTPDEAPPADTTAEGWAAADASGNTPSATPGVDAPVITSPADGDTVTSSTVTISGTAAEAGTLAVYDGSTQVTKTALEQPGDWSATAELEPGDHTLTASLIVAGAPSTPSVAVTVHVDSAPEDIPAAPAPEGAPVAPEITSPAAGAVITGPVEVSGSGTNADTVTLYDGDEQVTRNPVTVSDGAWTARLDLEPGDHTLTAVQRSADGTLSDSSTAVDISVEAVPEEPKLEDDPDAHLAHFLRHRILSGSRRPDWQTFVELGERAEAWLEAKSL